MRKPQGGEVSPPIRNRSNATLGYAKLLVGVPYVKSQSLFRIIMVVSGLYLPQAAHADTIILKNEVLYGKILAETMSTFRFRLNCSGRVVFIRKAAIVGVRHDNRCVA